MSENDHLTKEEQIQKFRDKLASSDAQSSSITTSKIDQIKSFTPEPTSLDSESKEEAVAKADTSNALVKLNVGGTLFTTTKRTLLNIPGSYFHLSFAGGAMKVLPEQEPDGSYFIDRNPVIFRDIINYMRTLDPTCIGNRHTRTGWINLRIEAEYFGLTDLIKYIQSSAGTCIHCKMCILDATRTHCLSPDAPRNHLRIGSIIESKHRAPHQQFERRLHRILSINRQGFSRTSFKCTLLSDSDVTNLLTRESNKSVTTATTTTNTIATVSNEGKDEESKEETEVEEGQSDDDYHIENSVVISQTDITRIISCGYANCGMGVMSTCPGKHTWKSSTRNVNAMRTSGIIPAPC